jgi:AcrR family transcriptional regulator
MPKNLTNIRHEIIQTTREMILENGYDKLNIRDVARRCGIATGTFYNYFRSKQDIVSSLLDADWKVFRQSIQTGTDETQSAMCQLETLYVNLKKLIVDVHSIWAAGFPEDLESGTLTKLQHIKKDLRVEFAQHVLRAIHGHVNAGQENFMSDFITRMFFSYGYDAAVDFEMLRPILEKLVT